MYCYRKSKIIYKGIITSNIGIIHLYRNSLQIIGDYKLNIMNTQSLEFYQSEISIPTLSMELNRTEIKDILRKIRAIMLMLFMENQNL